MDPGVMPHQHGDRNEDQSFCTFAQLEGQAQEGTRHPSIQNASNPMEGSYSWVLYFR